MAATTNELFGDQLTNLYGPVPSGVLESLPPAIAFVESIERLTDVRPSRTDVSGLESSSLTACGPAGTTFLTDAMNDAEASAVLGFSTRASEATTSAEVNVEPSSNLTPLRSWNVSTRLPSLNAQLVARSGVTWSLLLNCTSVS